jgi:hypothetical protein
VSIVALDVVSSQLRVEMRVHDDTVFGSSLFVAISRHSSWNPSSLQGRKIRDAYKQLGCV